MVYDRVNKWGGAERILLALHKIYPDAPLFTSVYDPKRAPWAKVFPKVYTSFLQKLPFAKNHHEAYFFLMPLAFESLNFENYDLVISVTSEAAKGIITQPKTLHVCYCLSSTRYLWQSYNEYFENSFWRFITRVLVAKLRIWDQIAAQRPDYFLAISQNVSQRIKKYYQRNAEVIYPPVSFRVEPSFVQPASGVSDARFPAYFLIVSRLVPYKRVALAIRAFNKLGLSLKIIGKGVEEQRLRSLAKPNIEFLGQNLTDDELLSYYQNCRALIFPGEEDFGLVPVEAQLCGKPVIAFKSGGCLESVVDGRTGKFFYPQTEEALAKAVKSFREQDYKRDDCCQNAQKFSQMIFEEKFKKYMEEITR